MKSSTNKHTKSTKRRFFVFILKLTIVGLVCFSLIILYYFILVSNSPLLKGEKWVIPAIVYSRPLELTVDQKISYEQFVHELKLLKYRKVASPKNPGEYGESANKSKIVVIRRSFQFDAQSTSSENDVKPLLLTFDNKSRISRIQDASTMEDIDYVVMDPVLLERIGNNREDRILISLNEVPKSLIDTIIYVEDREYYNHYGVNPLAIGRALVANLKAGKRVQGGSTITQQLVKNYFLTNEKSIDRKVKEIFMSLVVDARFSKEDILEMYLNEIYLGHGARDVYGFGLASYFYFGIPVSELQPHQIALMVGMIKGPSLYDPRRNPKKALERRNLVLSLMRDANIISESNYKEYLKKPLDVLKRGTSNPISVPSYISLLKDELSQRLGPNYGDHRGLVIFTSLDPQVQLAANNAVKTTFAEFNKKRKKNLETAVVVSNWRTSEILAVVGSSNPSFPGLNRVTRARRQIGSLIKPVAYLAAFNQGWHLGSMVHDSQVTVKLRNGQSWTPKNFDHKFLGWIPLYQAFANSRNVPMVRVGMDIRVENVVDTLHLLGIKQNINPVPSLLLGSISLTPLEVNQLYSTIATEGYYKPLSVVRLVRDNDGELYNRSKELDGEQVLDPRNAYLTIYGMTVVTSQGTAKILNKYNGVFAGKTGTSNDSRDSWFSGFDNDELVTIWTGYDDNTNTGLTGSSGSLKVYDKFISLRGYRSLEVAKPEGITFENFKFENDKSYIMDSESCVDVNSYIRLPVRKDMVKNDQRKKCDFFENIGEKLNDAMDKTSNFFKNIF
ncbi:MAG: penicillin-binding protein 1B [Succinivibrionaceae bacterium]